MKIWSRWSSEMVVVALQTCFQSRFSYWKAAFVVISAWQIYCTFTAKIYCSDNDRNVCLAKCCLLFFTCSSTVETGTDPMGQMRQDWRMAPVEEPSPPKDPHHPPQSLRLAPIWPHFLMAEGSKLVLTGTSLEELQLSIRKKTIKQNQMRFSFSL